MRDEPQPQTPSFITNNIDSEGSDILAILRVNPTRMELTRLKKRLKVARRGHKLLKDKRDELMKKFLELVRKNKELREKVEELLMKAHTNFLIARAVMSAEVLEEALMFPKQSVSLEVSTRNVMSVDVPVLNFHRESEDESNIYPYGFATTSGELDGAIDALSEVLPFMLELAQVEKSAQLLALEIEKTRRRVNALEYVLIPQLVETIKYITMKLDENERGNLSRLMKVKDMMLEQARQAGH
jgi:V/A-type H+/Na+-transporting ATPase subunit D